MKKIATESDIPACERNEAVLSLDNLRRRDAISPDMYKHYNTLLSSSLPTPTVKKVVDKDIQTLLNRIVDRGNS